MPTVRESFRAAGAEPMPSLIDCRMVFCRRAEQLADRLVPPPPQDVGTLATQAAELPRPPVAFEAVGDGDTQGWMVVLFAIIADPREEVFLASLRNYPKEAYEASAAEHGLARRFGVPSHFPSSDGSDLDAPRRTPARR
ncbi:hypothetical protein OG883_20960 [Streptomyces sp. NBC_01142]|uniref:hypothetical protein n=1 Tax=Streptomyces sp. NBC_01142 TaxID=2975865 RepID=UPI00225AD5D5|nr:hypothetical protein [Streptomyces sp. NBC_01142]MCX4822314.1 hypothetical protein [Streptomyces sp. NBC_01142]